MANNHKLNRRVASRLALLEATDKESFEEAFSKFSSMQYSGNQAKAIASVVRNVYKPMMVKEALLDLGLEEDEVEQFVDEPEDADSEEITEEISEVCEDDECDPCEMDEDLDMGVETDDEGLDTIPDDVDFASEEEDGVDFVGEEGETIDALPGEEIVINFGDDVLTITLDEGADLDMEETPDFGGETELEDADEDDVDAMDADIIEDVEEDVDDLDSLDIDEADDVDEDEESEGGITAMSKKRMQKQSQVEPQDRNLDGEEKARPSSKNMKMVNRNTQQRSNETGETMTLTGSEGNTLAEQNVDDFLAFEVPTSALDERFLNHNAKGKMTLEGEGGELVDQFKNVKTEDNMVPDNEGDTGMFGEDKSTDEFATPTQEPDNTGKRKVTTRSADRKKLMEKLAEGDDDLDMVTGLDVAEDEDDEPELDDEPMLEDEGLVAETANYFKKLASRGYAKELYAENLEESTVMDKVANNICDGCNNPGNMEVEEVDCADCGATIVLCSADIERGFCPGCNDLKKVAQDLTASNADYGDELCETPEGEGNPYGGKENGDGNFATKDKKGGGPAKHDAEEMDIDSGAFEEVRAEVADLRKKLAEAELDKKRLAVASRTAARMAERGVIHESEIEDQIEEFMNEGMSVAAMKNFEKNIVKLATKVQKSRVEGASVKTASKNEGIMPSAVAMPSHQVDGPVDMVAELSNVFMDKDLYKRSK